MLLRLNFSDVDCSQLLFLVLLQTSSKHSRSPLYTPGDMEILSEKKLSLKPVPYPRLALCDTIGQSHTITTDPSSAAKGQYQKTHFSDFFMLFVFNDLFW